MIENNDDTDNDNSEDFIKVILIGESGVGKTNLINVCSGREFDENEKSTLTASYIKKKIDVNGDIHILSLWDTIGNEKLKNLTKLFFKNSKIVVFVYDITSKSSFEELVSWEKDVKEMLGDDIIKGVVGNKQDLYFDEEVKENEGMEHAQNIGAKFLLTSAKNDAESFSKFLKELLIDYLDKNKNKKREKSIVLNKNKKQSKKKNGNCC